MQLKSKVFLGIGIISFFTINFIPKKTDIIMDVILTILLIFVELKGKVYHNETSALLKKNKAITLLSCLVSILLGIRFFYSWFSSDKLLKICFYNPVIKNLLLAGVTFLITAGCFVIISIVVTQIVLYVPDNNTFKPYASNKITPKAAVIFMITAIFCITVCSKSSPIYPFNNWDDANCFFTVGKSVTYHIVPYRDIFEQKGPLLYFIHTLAYFVSHTTFLGVYFAEILACFLFLLIAYKTLCLLTDSDTSYFFPVMATIIYSSPAFSHGGSAEEFCLPFIALCNYYGIKALKSNEAIEWKSWIMIGITSGAVLWIKFSLLGFYIGFGLLFAIIYIKRGWIKHLFQGIISLASGVLIVSLPILLYFIINNAVSDLFEVYFYDNLFLYSVDRTGSRLYSLLENLFHGYLSFIENYLMGFIMVITGIIYVLRNNKILCIYLLSTFFFSFFFIYSGGRCYTYYSFLFSVYVPLGMLLFISLFRGFTKGRLQKYTDRRYVPVLSKSAMYSICILFMFVFSSNTYMLKYGKDDLPQYQFDQYISQTEHPTLLNYGFLDGGFYTVSNIMPSCKYFCGLNIPYDEIGKTQNYFINNQLVDYVVTKGHHLSESQQKHYQYITEARFESAKNKYSSYYLYKKIP